MIRTVRRDEIGTRVAVLGVVALGVTLALLFGLLAGVAAAQEDLFIRARLAGAQVVPPVAGDASGQVTAVLIGNVLTVVGHYRDLASPIDRLVAGGAHIHQGAPGENGGIVFALNSDLGTDGSFSGVFALDDEQLQAFEAGEYYVQLHTEADQPGALRGQLAAPSPADILGVWVREVFEPGIAPAALDFRDDGTLIAAVSLEDLDNPAGSVAVRYRLVGNLLEILEIGGASFDCAAGTLYSLDLFAAGQLRFVTHRGTCSFFDREFRLAPYARPAP